MSFSSELKEELSKLNTLANKELVKYELIGYLLTNHATIQKNRILIKHYQLIITLESTIFECKMNQQIISIKGKNIEIRYYSQDEIMLMGEFTSIIFS